MRRKPSGSSPGWRAATATALDLAAATAFAKFANAKVSLSTVTPCFSHSTAYITHLQAGDAALGCTFKPSAGPFGSALHKLSDVDARFERHGRNRVSDDAHRPKISAKMRAAIAKPVKFHFAALSVDLTKWLRIPTIVTTCSDGSRP